MNYVILRDGVVVGRLACSPKQLKHNVPEGCEAREATKDDDAPSQPTPQDLQREVSRLAQEEIDRLERAKVRAITDHMLAPDTEIDVRGQKMLPRDRVAELEAAIAEQRKRL